MIKSEIKEVILSTAKTLKNGEYDINDELTDKIVFAARDPEEEYGDAAVIVEKGTDGTIYAYIDDGACYPNRFTLDEFVETYGE